MTPTPTPAAATSVAQQLALGDLLPYAGILFAFLVIAVLLLRRQRLRIKEIALGPLKLEPVSSLPQAVSPQPSVKISGNTVADRSGITVKRDSTEVSDNRVRNGSHINVTPPDAIDPTSTNSTPKP